MQFVLLASLWWLEDNEGEAPTQARLAAQSGADPMMTSQVIRKLEARGLLERHPDPNDSRAWRVRPTEPGRRLVARALKDVEASDERYFGALGNEDRAAFVKALAKLGAQTSQPTSSGARFAST